jgi:6-phosphogluconolactonase/glucosamine-6-phosphate isomerase/deaminase
MKFINATPEVAVLGITQSINKLLEKGSVLLLVSGGSNIKLAVQISNHLKIKNSLTIGLIDERYGPKGHIDSNWSQLLAAGLNSNNFNTLPIITTYQSLEDTSSNYSHRLKQAANDSDYVTGIFGIGIDGHTAGILPGSSAVESNDIVTHFIGPDYQRITITPTFMRSIDKAFLVSFGSQKHEQLALLQEALPTSDQPAQALKQITDLTIYTDYDKRSER